MHEIHVQWDLRLYVCLISFQQAEKKKSFTVNKEIASNVISYRSTSDRVAEIILKISKRQTLKIIQVYLPTSSHDEEIDMVYEEIDKLLDEDKQWRRHGGGGGGRGANRPYNFFFFFFFLLVSSAVGHGHDSTPNPIMKIWWEIFLKSEKKMCRSPPRLFQGWRKMLWLAQQ